MRADEQYLGEDAISDLFEDIVPSDQRTVSSLFAARRAENPFAPFIVSAETGMVHSYADIEARVAAIERELRAAGVEAGDRVAWISEASAEGLAIWLAIDRLGAVDICLGDALKGRVLLDMVTLSDPGAFVVTHSTSRVAQELRHLAGDRAPHIVDVSHEISWSSPGPASEAPPLEPEPPPSSVSPFELSTLMFTSGTTGPSKAVKLSNHHLVFAALMFSTSFHIDHTSALYSYSPMNHLTGRQLSLASLSTGAPLILRRRFDPEVFWEDIGRYRCTHAVMVGAAVPLLLQTVDRAASIESLRHIWAVPALPREHALLSKRLDAAVYVPYGTTEVGIVTVPDPDANSSRPGQCGRVTGPYEVAILDELGRELPVGAVGEIAIRPEVANSAFLGYWYDDAATVTATRGLWYHTNDLGRIDADGYLFFADRRDGFIRSKGENISSAEVAEIIRAAEEVADCAVVGIESDLADSDLFAFIVPSNEPLDYVQLFEWCCANLPHYMVPRYIATISSLPLTESGKVKRYALREWVAEGVQDAWDSRQLGLRASRGGVVRDSGGPKSAEAQLNASPNLESS